MPGDSAGARVNLVSPDGEAAIPLQFKRNSLAVYACIRAVSARENPETTDPTSSTRRSTPSKAEPKFDMVVGEHEMLAIQTVIKPHDELLGRTFRRGWKLTSSGNPVIIMPASKSYLDPGISYSRKDWPFRSTANWSTGACGDRWSTA